MAAGNLLVFDVDGVIIDVSLSYLEAARKTVRHFFAGAEGADRLPDPIFPLDDLARLKQTGGLNNDWDLTVQALSLLFTKVIIPDKYARSKYSFTEAIGACDVSPLLRFLAGHLNPLGEILSRQGKAASPFVLAWSQGDVGAGNLVKQIFQEIYLGRRLFTSIYGIEPSYHAGDGLIDQEKLLIAEKILKELAERYTLAIATGRPAIEADYPLDRFSIRRYFQAIVSLDDCLREEQRIFQESGQRVNYSKPHPYMLDIIPSLLGRTFQKCYYVGDMPDDMQAARSSRISYQGLGVTYSSSDPGSLSEKLFQAGASRIITECSELLECSLSSKH